MKITRSDFDAVAAFELLDPAVSARMWAGLELRASRRPSFNFGNVASYFGALIVISAMGWFMTLGFESFGGAGIACIAAAYAGAFVAAGRWLWPREGQRVPAGLLFTMAVCMTPLFVYGLEQATGLWPQGAVDSYRSYHVNVKGSWLAMELATLAAAGLALRSVRFPFLVAPAAFTLWYMSMDLTPLLFGKSDFDWDERKLVSLVFGLGMLAVAYAVDRLVREDFAFWLYLFGLMAFWGGLSLMDSHSELGKALYCLINLGLLGVGVLLRRRTFAVFGGLGVFGYLGYLSERVFRDSMLFPFALTALGLGIIGAAVLYQRHRETVEGRVAQWIPPGLKALLPPARE